MSTTLGAPGRGSSVRERSLSGWVTERDTRRKRVSGDTAKESSSAAPAGGRLTLEQRLDSVWEGLRTAGAAECPVCGGNLSAGGSGVAGRCARCGSTIS